MVKATATIQLASDGSFLVSINHETPQRLGCSHGTGEMLRDLLRMAQGLSPEDEIEGGKRHVYHPVDATGTGPRRVQNVELGDHPITKLPPKGRKLKRPELSLEDLGLTGEELLKAMETMGQLEVAK